MEPGSTVAQHHPAVSDVSRVPPAANPQPLGYVATFLWVIAAFLISTITAYIAYVYWLGGDLQRAINSPYDGALVVVGLMSSAPVQVAILLLATPRRGWTIPEYFGLVWPSRRDTVIALAATVLVVGAVETALLVFGHDLVPPFQIEAYRTAKLTGWLPALFAAIVIVAPLTEELVFRGFIYRGFAQRPGTEPIAIFVLTLGWMALHVQYDWVGMLQVFIIGVFLGCVRWFSGSTLLTIALHALMNLHAMIETVVRVEWLKS